MNTPRFIIRHAIRACYPQAPAHVFDAVAQEVTDQLIEDLRIAGYEFSPIPDPRDLP